MSTFAENMLSPEPWAGLMMGNHALVRAMLESRVHVCAAYPGSPTPEIADAIQAVPEEARRMHFEWSTNEKVALETAFGASINGHLSVCFFKSVGLNVALDTAQQLPLLELTGGLVIILGDDPGANSSQNEQDNRHIARMSYYPMYEPGNPVEAYAMFMEAAAESRRLRMPVMLRMTTHVCHAREVVQFGSIDMAPYDWAPRYDPHGLEYWPITANVFPLKLRALSRLKLYEDVANASKFTEEVAPNGDSAINGKRLGIISTGIPAYSILENLDENGASISLLKLGITFPLPKQRILDFLNRHDEVLLLEELDRILEAEVKALCWDNGVTCKLRVKPNVLGEMYEYDPARTWELLAQTWPDVFHEKKGSANPTLGLLMRISALASDGMWETIRQAYPEVVPERSALPKQMCPGCGHRSAFYATRELIQNEFPNAITVADIGCHSLGSMEPHEMGTVLLCMGHSNGTGAGLSLHNKTRPVITYIGDSTLYHAGLPAIANATTYNHNITLIVMENYTTAMTGHQPTAGSGEYGHKLSIPEILKALGVNWMKEVPAYQQGALQDALREAIAYDGFAVVIAKHPCMLKFLREKARKLAARTLQTAGR
ncbi:MAG: thiamine pyrophosphate-dependent enzyme [bacterium]|nr:thiamine pyrophosphate-dependent enzyme [bacterium]